MREGITYGSQSPSGGLKILHFLSFKFVSHVNCHYFCAGIEIQEVQNSWAFGENGIERHTAFVWENVLKKANLEARGRDDIHADILCGGCGAIGKRRCIDIR